MEWEAPLYENMPECPVFQNGDEWHPFKFPSLVEDPALLGGDGRGQGRVKKGSPPPYSSPIEGEEIFHS
jgi:hypothetical protein